MAFEYPVPSDLKSALSRIMDYCMEHEITAPVAQTMFEVGVGAYHNIQRRGITISVDSVPVKSRSLQSTTEDLGT